MANSSSPASRKHARGILRARLKPGLSKRKAEEQGVISSLGTFRNYAQCLSQYLEWARLNGIAAPELGSRKHLIAYLQDLAEDHAQSTVDQHHNALSFAFSSKIERVPSFLTAQKTDRAYRKSEFAPITQLLNERNAISAALCFFAGLRAHEPATILRRDECEPSTHRTWSPDRFVALPYNHVLYVVTGKGGLRREVAVPVILAEQLEERRLAIPKTVMDRGIKYSSNYDIGFGQSLSMAFTRASQAALGWSAGLHGLRHAYAQWRLRSLCAEFEDWQRAAETVSQELGHFRMEITFAYI
jgi:integrase